MSLMNFSQRLKSENYILFDGAFGTYYAAQTGDLRPPELANLHSPETVVQIHKEYINAGAQAIKTNTFGICSEIAPTREERLALLQKGWRLAQKAANGSETAVFADLGPALYGEQEDCTGEYIALIDAFLDCGAEYFLFETFPAFEGLKKPLAHLRKKAPHAFVIVSFAPGQDGYTGSGQYYKELLASALSDRLADAIGLNCVCGPSHLYQLVSRLELPSMNAILSVMPNAGYPAAVGGRTVYIDNTRYFAEKLLQLRGLGVQILGGCCGTTPAHIKAAAEMLAGKQPPQPLFRPPVLTLQKNTETSSPAAINPLRQRLESGQKVLAVELDPPADCGFPLLLERARQLKEAGAHVLTFADSPLARTRADSFLTAAKVKRETGLPVLPHLACRDRNIIAIKAALLGAKTEEIDNVLVITGDPVHTNGQALAKGVFSLNAYSLIKYIDNLNTDVFSTQPYFIGGALNINSANFSQELQRAEKKLQNGAKYFLTQAVFTQRAAENLQQAFEKLQGKILAGIMPLAGYKNAVFINNEVPGIEVPSELIQALEGTTPERAAEISVEFSLGIARKIKDHCHGYYIMTPLNKTELVCSLLAKIKEEAL